MSYSYNPIAKYQPSENYIDTISGQDLTSFKIVVQDDNTTERNFTIDFNPNLFFTGAYRHMKHGDFYDAGGFQSARSAYNKQNQPLKLWDT